MMAETNNGERNISEESQMYYYEKKIADFECPFTWGMSEVECIDEDDIRGDNEEIIPLMKFMRCIAFAYDYTRTNKDLQSVLEKLNDCDNVIQKIDHPEISIEAVLSVFRATKCFVFLHFEMEPELKQILAETNSIDSSEKKQTSTIKACQSIAWSNYSQKVEAIKCIREAIADNPNCDLWYFILGKTLRSKRRNANFNSKVDAEELESFEKAYDMMKNPVFGVYLGKAYNENDYENDKAVKIFESLSYIPQNDSLLLRIALVYIHKKEFQKANHYLNKVVNKNSSMFLHYKGLYHSKQRNYPESCPFFEKAIKSSNNLQAEYNYIYSMQKSENEEFNLTHHLLQMLVKYKNWSKDDVLQTITLHLAYTYFKKDKKIEESLKYFLDAIEINPDSVRLKELYRPVYLFRPWPNENIYAILSKVILPFVHRESHRFDEKTMQRALELEKYCKMHQPQN